MPQKIEERRTRVKRRLIFLGRLYGAIRGSIRLPEAFIRAGAYLFQRGGSREKYPSKSREARPAVVLTAEIGWKRCNGRIELDRVHHLRDQVLQIATVVRQHFALSLAHFSRVDHHLVLVARTNDRQDVALEGQAAKDRWLVR